MWRIINHFSQALAHYGSLRYNLCKNECCPTINNAVNMLLNLYIILCMLILFIFKVAILKTIYNMASSNINLTLKVTDRMILPLA